MDQRTCIKFCLKNEIKCADAFRMSTVTYGEATLDRSNVYRWYKMFSEGREDVNDEKCAGRPSTSTTYWPITGPAKFVPTLLNCDQKQHRMNIANEMFDSVRDDPNLLQRVIIGDEAWVYGYDVETKAQSSQWKLPHEPRPKKARQIRSNVKVLLTVFFDCRGVVHHEFLPQGRTVNKEYYLQVMRNLREEIRQKGPDLRKNKNWLLHHDNAPAHTSLLVRDFLAKNNTLMMPQPPYSPWSPSQCGKSHHAHTTTTAPSTFHIGFTTEPVKVDRMTENNDMQRMTEAGNEYFADALTNMQPHYEDLVSRLTDSIRGLAIPRVEETLISPFDGSYAANNFIQQLERTSEGPQDDATLQARLRTLLKGEPLSLYNELNLASLPYSQAKQTLIDLYPGKSEVTFTKFLTFKLNNQIQLGEYYRQKITMGLQLGLTNPIIVEALTEGLQASDQRLMRAIAPKTLTEWYSTMNRIKGTNSLPTSSEPLQGVTNTSAFHRDTRTPSRGRNYNTFSPNNTLRYPSGARKPPSPCKYCQGDHWNNECSMNRLPYRQQAYHGQPTAHSFPPERNVAHNLPVPTPRTKSDKIIALRPYRTSLSDQREIQEQVEKMLEYDIIEPSFSPYSSPVTLVTKKDKTKRFCVDYRRLNEIIVPDVHPLPLIENILDKLANAKIYSRADFSSAYWSIEISPPDRNLLSFVTLEGQYNFKRLPYGIKIGPQVYERAVSQILQRNRLGFIAHYFDDFIIFSNSIEEHLDHLQQFFDMCNRENFRLNYNKCDFFKTTIEFLGYTISSCTYTPLVKNLDVINATKVPTSVKSLQSFLGSINVYNKFIKDHARIRNPLNNLLKKNTPWHWDAKCQHSFDTLRECLTTKPVLHLFKEGLPCQLFCDASLQGIAGVLKQQHPDGTLHPVQYYSRALRPHEKNYTITELECLAVIDSVEKFRIYLAGVRFPIFTDHHALQWLKTIKKPNGIIESRKLAIQRTNDRHDKEKLKYDNKHKNPHFDTGDLVLKKKKAYKPIVNVADLEREDEMVISRNCSILSSIGHPALKSLHEELIRYIASRTEMIKALATEVENLTDTLESFAELDEIEEANKPKTACRGTQTCPAPSCKETSSQTDPIKPATPAPAALPAKKPASTLPAPALTKRKQSEALNPPAKRTNLNGPSKPAPSRVSKPAAAQVILHGEKSAAHTVVISDDPQADPREMLKAVRAAHTLPQGVWASLHTKGKLVLHSSNPDTIPEVTTSLASKLNGLKVRQQKEILPRICLFKVDEETSNSTIEETFLETAAVRKLPGDKVARVAHRSAPRSGTCTAFIEVDLKTFRALGVRGRIVVDGVILNFEESIRVCFRCCGFGHNSAQCSRAPKCFHCGQDGHEGRACPSIADQRTSKGANCCSKGLPDKHEARASSCPILKSRALKF
ncbi:hypothetical protein LAZ67_23000513 [Cordylochernes scorpioides]|uniref:Reverse transcriptase n=1 Tax=Cordylochernes scorpioides TaxID=51811 RepID=A0ABY6LTZ7_9ARAC|nr:hypothetical protein LAZ67_23000513 [Cordylochernes scorpioides]